MFLCFSHADVTFGLSIIPRSGNLGNLTYDRVVSYPKYQSLLISVISQTLHVTIPIQTNLLFFDLLSEFVVSVSILDLTNASLIEAVNIHTEIFGINYKNSLEQNLRREFYDPTVQIS